MDILSVLGVLDKPSKGGGGSSKSSVKGSKSLPDRNKKLSDNVKDFVAKKEAKEKQRRQDALEKKQNLLALRAQDKKNTRAAKTMTKVAQKTRSAPDPNVLSAHTDNYYQCDSDDFGYESSAADIMFQKLVKKFEASPSDPMDKFKPMKKLEKTSTSTSADAAKFQPYRKPSDPKRDSSQSSTSQSDKERKGSSSSSSVNKNKKAPPPPSFAELLKIAEQKGGKPPPVAAPKNEAKEAEFKRPMTQKEKEEYMRERNSQLRKAGKLPPTTTTAAKKGPEFHPAVVTPKEKAIPKKASVGPCKENNFTQPCQKPKRDIHSVESRPFPAEIKPPPKKVVKKPPPTKRPSSHSSRERSPSPVRKMSKASHSKNRIESDDEEDYDSEMDDFIDDSDAKVNYSDEIARMFGYDRRKYRDEDDFDDRDMENNRFADIMKEEARSARIGMQEDLEDMRKEEEEKRRKMMKKKRK